MEDRDEEEEDREVTSMKTYHMSSSSADSKKITGFVITKIGTKIWCLNGKMHREDGPACEWADGYKAWFLNGKQLTEPQWKAQTQKHTIVIDGKEIKISHESFIALKKSLK